MVPVDSIQRLAVRIKDRNDRSLIARLRVAQLHGYELRTSAIVIA